MMVQLHAKIGSPTREVNPSTFELRWKTWTISGSIIAVWESYDPAQAPDPTPVVCVINAASGNVSKTIYLPKQPDEEYQPWERMEGAFHLDAFALSPDEKLLALACADQDDLVEFGVLVWLVDLECDHVVFRQVRAMSDQLQLVFSGASDVVAVHSTGIESQEDRPAEITLLQAASGETIFATPLSGSKIYPISGGTAFILPYYRIMLFQHVSSDSQFPSQLHVPAASKDPQVGGYVPHHAHVRPGMGTGGSTDYSIREQEEDAIAGLDEKSCTVCKSLTLDGGSCSPCGSLFVTLGAAGRQVVLEHWHLDFQSSSCYPHLVCSMPMSGPAKSLPRHWPEGSDPVHLLVEWHPSSGDRLLHAVAVQEGSGLIYLVNGGLHTVMQIVDLAEDAGFTGPISRLQWSPDGRALAVLAQNSVYIIAAG